MCYFCFIEVERSSVGSEGVKMLWLTRDWNPSSLLLKLGFITAQIQHYSEEFFHLETTFQVLLTVVGKCFDICLQLEGEQDNLGKIHTVHHI